MCFTTPDARFAAIPFTTAIQGPLKTLRERGKFSNGV
jgi:hypothetical protein